MRLYHYTSVAAVYSILKNRKIWITDIRFLNDSKELHIGMELLLKNIVSASPNIYSNHEYWEMAKSFLLNEISNSRMCVVGEDPLYVFSLSSDGDCLSQWRAYGSYAIEFDSTIIESEVSKLQKCLYRDDEKLISAQEHALDSIVSTSNAFRKYNGMHGPDTINASFSLYLQAAIYKHIGFQEEKESRIIISPYMHDFEYEVKYRPKGDLLVPYVELDLPLECIKSVTVGPHPSQELALASMSEYVRAIEKDWQISQGNIEFFIDVKASKIPYRPVG
ncbi:DUF2971 domain-containing protein [Rheinheimera sp. F8]|uniref:DUF2971 domain-containing protein n=1 Tax=Rheinheimera sp. F8 TaxID=1763998 RepID=UPI0007448800|nr:DUF2971 domain-containing protein [Rheinheimera sp. F8]ALZ75380.1 hypothetical protein ATY27_06180 [Rheinheimera sp. F8]ALZ75806.1 hypothetical protein ATY27_08525 [Rheinheimera sp. F8]